MEGHQQHSSSHTALTARESGLDSGGKRGGKECSQSPPCAQIREQKPGLQWRQEGMRCSLHRRLGATLPRIPKGMGKSDWRE